MVVSGWYEKGRCVGRLGRTRRRGKERERERAAGAFCLALRAGCVFGNCELGCTKQNTWKSPSVGFLKSLENLFYEEEVILYLLFQASIAALPWTWKSLWESTPCKEWGERGVETLEATELKNWHAGTVNYSRHPDRPEKSLLSPLSLPFYLPQSCTSPLWLAHINI